MVVSRIVYGMAGMVMVVLGVLATIHWNRDSAQVQHETLLDLLRNGTAAQVQAVLGEPDEVFSGRARPAWLFTWSLKPGLCSAVVTFDPSGSRVDDIDVWEEGRRLLILRRSIPPEPIPFSRCLS